MTMYYSPSTNGFYDSNLSYSSLPEDLIEITQSLYQNLLDGHYKNNKEIYFDGTRPALRDITPPPITWDVIQGKRNKLLSKSDYTQMPDWPGNKVAWAKYRQELRDITENFAKPEDVVFPTPPEE